MMSNRNISFSNEGRPPTLLNRQIVSLEQGPSTCSVRSLLASQTLVEHDPQVDVLLKWVLCVIVAIVVDIAWLFVGVKLQRAALRPLSERILNFTLAATIVLAAIFTLL
jgi:threonine/homoserine/homoserine lactone efflux protein